MNLLIAEDDPFHRSFLRAIVSKALPDCEEIFEAVDGDEALECVKRESIGGVVMDLQMPKASGVAAASGIWHHSPTMRILFWSNYADEAYVRGISRIVPADAVYGYLLKTASEHRLELAVQGVFQEDQCVVDREVRGVQQRSQNIHEGLSDAEFEVLRDIALGMTDKVIAARRSISTRGVQSRLKSLYDKMGIDPTPITKEIGPAFNSRTRAVAVAMSRGLLNAEGLAIDEERYKAWLDKVGL